MNTTKNACPRSLRAFALSCLVVGATACGDDANPCEQACQTMEACGIKGQCAFEGCPAEAIPFVRCINVQTCDSLRSLASIAERTRTTGYRPQAGEHECLDQVPADAWLVPSRPNPTLDSSSANGSPMADDGACETACIKLESCGVTPACVVAGPCNGEDFAVATCVNAQTCEQLLSGGAEMCLEG